MKKVLSISTLALAGALFVGCSEAPSSSDVVQGTASLVVLASDQQTGELLQGATVTLLAAGAIGTDGNGAATFNNVPIGEGYEVKVEKEGYAPVVCTADIGFAGSQQVVATSTVVEVQLYQASATVEGLAIYQDPTPGSGRNMLPAKGAELQFRMTTGSGTCEFANKVATATVGEDGKYSVNLPVGIAINASSVPYLVGEGESAVLINGVAVTPISSLALGEKRKQDLTFGVRVDLTPRIILSSPQFVDSETGAVVIEFSHAIDWTPTATLTKSDVVEVENGSSSTPVGITYEWSGSKLTIKPIGKWVKNVSYTITLPTLYDEFGQTFSNIGLRNFQYQVREDKDIRDKKVATPTCGVANCATAGTKSIVFSGLAEMDSTIAGDSYEIWRLNDGDDEYKPLSTKNANAFEISGDNVGKYLVNVTTATTGTTYKYIVRAYNGTYYSKFSDPFTITVPE